MNCSENTASSIQIVLPSKSEKVIWVKRAEPSGIMPPEREIPNTLPDDGNMQLFFREDNANNRSQDFDIYYRLNGAIYIVKIERLLKEESLFLKTNTFAYCMDTSSSVDIDKEEDLLVAKCFAKNFLTIKNSRSNQ